MEEIAVCNDCGLKYVRGDQEDELHHRRYHDESINGPHIDIADGHHTIDCRSLLAIREATGRAAMLAKRDAHYDFPSYVADDDDPDTKALIRVQKRRIIGLIVTRTQECAHTVELDHYIRAVDDVQLKPIAPERRTAVEMIWVLKAHRGASVAKELVAALTKKLHLDCNELAHLLPFTEPAVKFWQKLGITTVYVV